MEKNQTMKIPRFKTLREAMEYSGLLDGEYRIPTNGEIVRVPNQKHPHGQDGRLIGLDGGAIYVMNYGNLGMESIYSPDGKTVSTAEDEKKINASYWKRQQELGEKKLSNSKKAIQFLAGYCRSYEKEELHQYLCCKCIKLYGNAYITTPNKFRSFFRFQYPDPLNFDQKILVLPLFDGERVTSLQFISSYGVKKFMKGGTTKGTYWIGYNNLKPDQKEPLILIGEGMATVMSVANYKLKQEPKANLMAVAAMNCGNLEEVAKKLRSKFLTVPILILADNDQNGIGEKKAKEAATSISQCKYSIPKFTIEERGIFEQMYGKEPTDWNDFYIINKLI